MRHVDADSLISLVQDATILSNGFKQVFVAIVNGEPTIEPERKKGKWIDSDRRNMPYRCDQCGRSEFTASNFCPHCGSQMERG